MTFDLRPTRIIEQQKLGQIPPGCLQRPSLKTKRSEPAQSFVSKVNLREGAAPARPGPDERNMVKRPITYRVICTGKRPRCQRIRPVAPACEALANE